MKNRMVQALFIGALTIGMVGMSSQTSTGERAAVAIAAELTDTASAAAEEATDENPVLAITAGVRIFAPIDLDAAETAANSETDVTATTEAADEEESEYADLAIANVSNYVNVRSGASTSDEIVGKIYSGAVAQVLETVGGEDGDWFRIVSGNVEGYIKAEYFWYGDEAAAMIDDYVTRYAVVNASRLNVRSEADLSASRIGYIDNGEKVQVIEDLGDWIKVQYTGSKTGYVSAEYVTVTEEFVYAKTLEEEAAEIAAQQELAARETASETEAAEDVTVTATAPSGSYEDAGELRSSIVEYAMQFLGNKYVHGGQTLEGGTDCSGFTSLIYAAFGYSISRTPSGQLSGDGTSVSIDQMQPGDIICYGSGGTCTHVAMYIGNGQIIHSANPRKGVVIYSYDYDTILGVKNIIG